MKKEPQIFTRIDAQGVPVDDFILGAIEQEEMTELLMRGCIREIIVEAKFDKQTTEISREIIDQFKKGVLDSGGNAFNVKIPPPQDLLEYLDLISLNVSFSEYIDAPRISGEYTDRIVAIDLDLPVASGQPTLLYKTISSWFGELKGTIRHELEHALQDHRGELNDWYGYDFENVDDFLDYWYDPVEVEAFATDIYKQAKIADLPVNKFIDEYVEKFREEAEDFVYEKEMTERDIERHGQNIRDEVTKTINDRYPAAIFEVNEYGWEVSSKKNMLLDKEGMEQSDKDDQEKYLKSMGLMEGFLTEQPRHSGLSINCASSEELR